MSDLVPRQQWEEHAASLVERYAGFSDARNLTPEERAVALVSLVDMALTVVGEARDTIERLNAEVEALRAGEQIEDADLLDDEGWE